MSGGSQPNPNYALYGNPLPNFTVSKDRVVHNLRILNAETLRLPVAQKIQIDPNSPNDVGNNNPADNETLRNVIPQAGALVYCDEKITQNKTKDPCFDGRNHLYFSDGENWIPLANCLPKNVHDSKAVDALGLTVLRGRRGSPLVGPFGLGNAADPTTGSNAQMGLAAPATEVIVPPSLALPPFAGFVTGSTGIMNVIPWQGFDVNSIRPNGVAVNVLDPLRYKYITNPRPDEFSPDASGNITTPKGYVDFKVPENGLFHVKFQGYFEYRADSDPKDVIDNGSAGVDPNVLPSDTPITDLIASTYPDGEQLYLGLIFTDADDTINPFRDLLPLWPVWNTFFSAPRRIFRETVFTQSEMVNPSGMGQHEHGYKKGMGRMVHCEWAVNSSNLRASPLAEMTGAPPWLWNLNPGRFKPGQKCRVWPVTSSNCLPAESFLQYPSGWNNVKFQWKYGGKWYTSGRDYPDIKIEVDGVPDNFQEDAPNPPPGADQPVGLFGGAAAM